MRTDGQTAGRDESNRHIAAFLGTGLKIRHPFSFNWSVSEDRDFYTNWTTADETLRLFLHQCITLCRKYFALHFQLHMNCLSFTAYFASFVNHATSGTVQWECLKFMERHTHVYVECKCFFAGSFVYSFSGDRLTNAAPHTWREKFSRFGQYNAKPFSWSGNLMGTYFHEVANIMGIYFHRVENIMGTYFHEATNIMEPVFMKWQT